MGKKATKSRSCRWYEELVEKGPCIFTEQALDRLTTKELGDIGESLAADYLHEHGFEIVEFNYRCPEGEADLIAFDLAAEQVVLVEVKTRRSHARPGDVYPEEAVTPRKERRYRRIASYYALEHFPIPSMRFDVVAVTLSPGALPYFVHLTGAFDWEAGL